MTDCEALGHRIRLNTIGEDARCPCGLSITWEILDSPGRLGSQVIARVERDDAECTLWNTYDFKERQPAPELVGLHG